jgi:hypothetical protein
MVWHGSVPQVLRHTGSHLDRLRRRVANTGIAFAVVLAFFQSSSVALASDVEEESRCPTLDAVQAAVRSLLGPTFVETPDQGAHPIAVHDLGDRYRVDVKGRTREYADETRDCGARARAAAVFVALTLAPSQIDSPGAAVDVPPVTASASPRDATPPPPIPFARRRSEGWYGQIELGALGAAAPRASGSQLVAGAELRLVVTTPTWGFSLGAGLPTQATFDAASVRVREGRYPFDIGIRRFWTAAWLGGGIDLGALAALCRMEQVDQSSATQTHIELGIRSAATLAASFTRFGLYIRAFSEFIPVTRQIAIEPRGIIGRTSPLWIGATVGLAARFY